MKNIKFFSGILVILLFAGNVNAQSGMHRMKPYPSTMKCDSACMQMWKHGPMAMKHDSLNFRHGYPMGAGMRDHRAMMMHGYGMHRMGPRPDMMARDWRGPGDRMAMDRRMRIEERIPDLTDKQKEEITKIRQENQLQMQQLREKQQKEMTEARETSKKKVMSILTDEQKKQLEEKK
jgi:hypothetical protein